MLELKKVKSFPKMAQETECFTAELWDNGKLVAYVENNGHGGSNMIKPAKGLTSKDVAKYDTLDIEAKIFDMVIEFDVIRKFQSKHFIYKKGEDYITQKFPISITELKKHKDYSNWLVVQKKKIEHRGGILLNKNL